MSLSPRIWIVSGGGGLSADCCPTVAQAVSATVATAQNALRATRVATRSKPRIRLSTRTSEGDNSTLPCRYPLRRGRAAALPCFASELEVERRRDGPRSTDLRVRRRVRVAAELACRDHVALVEAGGVVAHVELVEQVVDVELQIGALVEQAGPLEVDPRVEVDHPV